LTSLKKELCILEPLNCHNAILYEKHGFGYLKGLKSMEEINTELAPFWLSF